MEVCRIVVYVLLTLHMIMVLRIMMMMMMIALTMAALMHSTRIIYCITVIVNHATIHLNVVGIVVAAVTICCGR